MEPLLNDQDEFMIQGRQTLSIDDTYNNNNNKQSNHDEQELMNMSTTRNRDNSVMNSINVTRTLSMQLNEETQVIENKATIAGCIFNYTNSIVGAGIIGLPYALKTAGFYYGILLLIGVAILIDYGVRSIVECGIQKNKLDYELLCEYLFGKVGYYSITAFMFLFAYGAMIAYHVKL